MKKILMAICLFVLACSALGCSTTPKATSVLSTPIPQQESETSKASSNMPGLVLNVPESGWQTIVDNENMFVISYNKDTISIQTGNIDEKTVIPVSEEALKSSLESSGTDVSGISDFVCETSTDGQIHNISYKNVITNDDNSVTTIITQEIYIGDSFVLKAAALTDADQERIDTISNMLSSLKLLDEVSFVDR